MAIREEREREESKERETALEQGEDLLIKMFRFVFITTAIINPSQVNIHSNNKNNESRTEQEKKEREEKEPYLGMRSEKPLLRYPGFNALFYTTCPGGHQRSPTSPILSKMEQNRPNSRTGLFCKG